MAENTRLEPTQALKVRRLADEIATCTAPHRLLARITAHAGDPAATAFERYAGLVVRNAAGPSLLQSSVGRSLALSPSGIGKSVKLSCTDAPDDELLPALSAVECALNRLIFIAGALEGPFGSNRAEGDAPGGISHMGVDYLPGVRLGRAQVMLPPIGRAEQAQPSYFNEVDWRVLDSVANGAHAVFQSSMLPNMRQSVMGSSARDGSDWDVRTRLGSILTQLETPLGLSCRFDCDASARTVSVSFLAPAISAFPHLACAPGAGTLEEAGERVQRARVTYLIRASCLIAASCFGSGKKIERAYVTALEPVSYAPSLSSMFERESFVRNALLAIDSGKLSSPSVRFDPHAVAEIAAPNALRGLPGDERGHALDDGMGAQRIEPWKDERILANDLRTLFHVERICDIDTRHYHGGHARAIDEARKDADESPLAAIARLESLVAELGEEAAHDDPAMRPLYCGSPLARAMVALLDDHFAVSEEALAFLNPQDDASTAEGKRRFFRAPSALYHAHMGLSDLYERLGDSHGAEMQADRCIDLAPTSAQAHFRKADVLAQQGRFAEAANIIMDALRFAVSERDCSLLYYHLALLMWRLGRKNEAASIYVYMSSLQGDYTEKATKTVIGLRARDASPVIVYASPLAAAREMARARIPVAPSDAARLLVARAAVGLSCMGAPLAAAPYAAELARYLHGDPVVRCACDSLLHGTSFG